MKYDVTNRPIVVHIGTKGSLKLSDHAWDQRALKVSEIRYDNEKSGILRKTK